MASINLFPTHMASTSKFAFEPERVACYEAYHVARRYCGLRFDPVRVAQLELHYLRLCCRSLQQALTHL